MNKIFLFFIFSLLVAFETKGIEEEKPLLGARVTTHHLARIPESPWEELEDIVNLNERRLVDRGLQLSNHVCDELNLIVENLELLHEACYKAAKCSLSECELYFTEMQSYMNMIEDKAKSLPPVKTIYIRSDDTLVIGSSPLSCDTLGLTDLYKFICDQNSINLDAGTRYEKCMSGTELIRVAHKNVKDQRNDQKTKRNEIIDRSLALYLEIDKFFLRRDRIYCNAKEESRTLEALSLRQCQSYWDIEKGTFLIYFM